MIFVEETNEGMTKINTFMWNTTLSLFHSLGNLIKNNNLSLAKKLGLGFVLMQDETVQA